MLTMNPECSIQGFFKSGKLRSTLAHHLAAPLPREREAFLLHLQRQGTSPPTVAKYAPILIQIIRSLGLTKLRDVGLNEVLQARDRRRYQRALPAFSSKGQHRGDQFAWLATKWLSFHGRLKLPPRPREPWASKLNAYAEFMRYRGLTPLTIRWKYTKSIQFLRWFSLKRRSFRSIRLNDVDQYLSLERASGLAPGTSVRTASALRSFFKYAARHRWCSQHLGLGIERPWVPKPRFLPQGSDWREIREALGHVPTRPSDVRAHAILSLLAGYALRPSEVTRLLLTDVNWRDKILSVRRSKGGRFQRFPIPQQIEDALLNYILRTRPQASCPNFFVTLYPPFRPISSDAISKLIIEHLERLGIKHPPHCPRSIRHGCATYLLEAGSSLREVSDFLGHLHIRSTSIYAKCDMKSLRAVADFDLSGLK
jgi:integrase/recombinase XerD